MKKLSSYIGVTILSAALVACGGGSGGSTDDDARNLPDERPQASVSGVAFDGLIIGGDVKVYDFTGGNKGSLLGSAKTDGSGLYSVTLSTSDKPVLIEVDGGYYLEEASGKQVQVDRDLGYKLMAVEYYESGKSLEVAATFFSTIATGYAQHLIGEGINAGAAIEMAYQEVDGWAGFNTRRTVPVDVSNPANVTPYITNPHRYGFVAGAISYLTLKVGESTGSGIHDSFTSINFIGTAYRDISSDGLLDGKADGVSIYFGDLTLDSNIYRELLALRMVQFAISDNNLSGLDFDEVLPFASQINLFSGDVFNNIVAPDITTSEPTIEQFLPSEGETLSGSYPASAIVSDVYGLESIEYFVDGQYVGAGDLRNPVRPIDTLNFSNGPHTVTIVVTNVMGNTASETHNIVINNGQLSLSGNGDYYTYDGCKGTYKLTDTTGLGVDYVTVAGTPVMVSDPMPSGSATISKSIPISKSSCVATRVNARDMLGNDYSFPIRVRVGYWTRVQTGPREFKSLYRCRFDMASSC